MIKFLKKLFSSQTEYIVATINARIQPIHRGEIYEDPLDDILKRESVGEIVGGGTLQSETGEIEYCEIEIEVSNSDQLTIDLVRKSLEQLGVPKGSKLLIESTDTVIEFGELEGLGIYLNGTDLDDEVYANCDSNHVYTELDRLTEGTGRVFSFWQGETETAFYLYGSSFDAMKSMISELVENYPLCQKCRIEQVA